MCRHIGGTYEPYYIYLQAVNLLKIFVKRTPLKLIWDFGNYCITQ